MNAITPDPSRYFYQNLESPQQESGEALIAAIKNNDPDLIRANFSKDALEYVDQDGFSALNLAAYQGTGIDILLERIHREDVGILDRALVFAVASGRVSTVIKLLEAGANVGHANEEGHIALHKAASLCRGDIVKVLLEWMGDKKVAVDSKAVDGATPLMHAAARGHSEALTLLLQAGAYIGHRDKYGRTALHAAVYCGHFLEGTYELLFTQASLQGVPIDSEDDDGVTPLLIASENANPCAINSLLKNGASLTHVDKVGRSALHCAAVANNWFNVSTVIKAMRTKGITLDLRDKQNRTALMYAACLGSNAIVDTLLKEGASIDLSDNRGWTALHFAASKQMTDVIKTLLEHKADYTVVDCDGETTALVGRVAYDKYASGVIKEKDIRTFEYSRELRQRLLIASFSNLRGISTSLSHPNKLQNSTVTILLNTWYPRDLWATMRKRALDFFTSSSPIPKICKYAAADLFFMYDYTKGKILVVNTRCSGNYVPAILWHTYLIVCMKDTYIVCSVDPKKISYEYISGLQKGFISREQLVHFVTGSSQPADGNTALLERCLSQSNHASEKTIDAAMYALLVLNEVKKRGFTTAEDLEKIATEQLEVFKEWNECKLTKQIERYVRNRNHKYTSKEKYPHDWQLLEQVKQKGSKALAEKIDRFRQRAEDEGLSVALIDAMKLGQYEASASLLAGRVALDYADFDGNTLLHHAVDNNDGHIFALVADSLQRNGLSLDSVNKKGQTALMDASMKGNAAVVDELVKRGAALDVLSQSGHSALALAVQGNSMCAIKTLADAMNQKGVSLVIGDPLHVAAKLEHVAAMHALFDAGIDINVNHNGFSALHTAAEYNRSNAVRGLLARGANITELCNRGYSALLVARQRNHKGLYSYMKAEMKVKNERVYEYSRELRQRKFLAHILAIDGQTSLLHPDSMQNRQVKVELSGWHFGDMWHIIVKRGKAFFKKSPEILATCMTAVECFPQKLVDRYHSNKPIIVNIGFETHHVSSIMWGPFFIICNRGAASNSSCEILSLDPKMVTVEFIQELQGLKDKTGDEYVKYFNNKFPLRFSTPIGDMGSILAPYLQLPLQEMGNCTFANSEAVIYALLFLEQFMSHLDRFPPPKEREAMAIRQKKEFEDWRAFMIGAQVDSYLRGRKHPTAAAHLYPRDWELLKRVKEKAPAAAAQKIELLTATDDLQLALNRMEI